MKTLVMTFIFLSISIYGNQKSSIEEPIKNLFFIFSSEIDYEILSKNKECVIVDSKQAKQKSIFQKAIYLKLINSDKCVNSTNEENHIIIKYANQGEFIIPINISENKYILTSKEINSKDNKFSIHSMFSPSGILMLEINKKRLKTPINHKKKTEKVIAPINSDNSKYKITFPWLCLEYCGGNSGAEIAEFARNKEVLTSVSYEKYTMDNGVWTTLNLTDPTTTIVETELTAWPMIRSDSRTYNEDQMAANLESMWTNKETLATSMVNNAVNNNYEGYCMDIEFQTTRTSTRDRYIQLVDFFADKLHESGKKLMVAHAHWATMAPMPYLKNTSVDYVVTMDPYTASDLFFRKNGDETRGQAYEDYTQIEPGRLIWGFAWEYHVKSSQEAQWEWLQTNGYNEGVLGAAVWRAPAENMCKSGCNTSTQGINYYDAFERYYPIDKNIVSPCDNILCSGAGVCQEVNNEASCNCYDGYHNDGLECIKDVLECSPEITCSNHGTCDDSTGIIKCICDENYISTGLDCISNTTIKKKIIKTINSENFKLQGPLPYFHNENTGINENSVYCYQNNIDSENKFILTINNLQEGKYRVYSYIPDSNKLSNSVNYSIKNNSSIKNVNLNQINNKNDWAYLGEYQTNNSLELSVLCYNQDISMESFKKIYFSAIKLELLEEK